MPAAPAPATDLGIVATCERCSAATWPASQPCPRCVRERAELAAQAREAPREPAGR